MPVRLNVNKRTPFVWHDFRHASTRLLLLADFQQIARYLLCSSSIPTGGVAMFVFKLVKTRRRRHQNLDNANICQFACRSPGPDL